MDTPISTNNIVQLSVTGTVIGIISYIAGYSITFLFIFLDNDEGRETSDAITTGWAYHNSQFADHQVTISQGERTETMNFITGSIDTTVPSFLFHLAPIVVLIAAGFICARYIGIDGPHSGALVGSAIVCGTILSTIVGTQVFVGSITLTGNEVQTSLIMSESILLVGILYPVVFGGIGGFLSQQKLGQKSVSDTEELQRNEISYSQSDAQEQTVDQSSSVVENNSNYVDDVVHYFERNDWDIDQSNLREGVDILMGVQGNQRLLSLVITEPEEQVTSKHLKYLIKKGQEKNVDTKILTTTVNISGNSRTTAAEYHVEMLEPTTVLDATESQQQASKNTASRSSDARIESQQQPNTVQESEGSVQTSRNSKHQPTEPQTGPAKTRNKARNGDGDASSPFEVLQQYQGKQCLKYTVGIFAAIGLGYGVGLILLSIVGDDLGTVVGLLALMLPIFGSPIIAVMTGMWVGQNIHTDEKFAAVASASGAFLGFLSLLIILLVFSALVSPSGEGDLGGSFAPLLVFGAGVSATAAATTTVVRRIKI